MMKCPCCKEFKLSKEFPFYPLTENCDHPLLHCLDCATASVRQNKKCSQCENTVNEDNKIYLEYLESLDFLFPPEETNDDRDYQSEAAAISSGEIYIITLFRESATLTYHPLKTILEIKKEVERELKIPSEKQRLLFERKQLKVKNERNELLMLKHYNVKPGSTFQLIILLCAVPEELDHVIFDFYWGLPRGKIRDYLDVSVFVYSGEEYLGYINFKNTERRFCPGVIHSGRADMNDTARGREGHHQVNVFLKLVPHHIDKLVFTLSAWASSSISAYPYSKLRFYDVNFPDKQLCSDEMSHAEHCESIIMCCLSRRKGGGWETLGLRKGASGFTQNYTPLKKEIRSLLEDGLLDVKN